MIRLNYLGSLLNALMLATLVAAALGVIARFVPGWQPLYLAGASFVVAIEASAVHHAFRRERLWADELARYLLPELMVMLALMRVATTLAFGAGTLAESLRTWFYAPLTVFDRPFLAAILLGIIVGWLAHRATADLLTLGPQPYERDPGTDLQNQRIAADMAEERALALRRISGRFITGGLLLLGALSLEVVNIERIGGPARPLSTLSAVAALVYVICGFLLYSQARLALLRSRWNLEGMAVAENVSRRWAWSSWLLVTGVVLAAALLPRSYGMGLLDTIRALFNIIAYVIVLVGTAAIWLVGVLALIPALILALFMWTEAQPAAPPPFVPPPPPPEVAQGPWEQRLIPAIVFWFCMLALLGYALWIVAQRNPGLWHALTSRGPIGALVRLLSAFWRGTRAWTTLAAQTVRERLHRAPPVVHPIPPRLRSLAPRELVRYFYRSTLRRAAERGLARRPGQTPYEYRQTLAGQVPETEQDVSELTEAFVAAQYSPRAPEIGEARRIVRPWARLRRRLRGMYGQPRRNQ